MKIAIVGYGKMGHMIENSARNFGHEIAVTVDVISKDAACIVPQGDYDAVAKAVPSDLHITLEKAMEGKLGDSDI